MRYYGRLVDNRFEVPIAMLDVFQLMLLLVVAFRVSSVNSARLPELRDGGVTAQEAAAGPAPLLVELDVEGQARIGGKVVAFDTLGDALSREAAEDRPIRLAVETRPDGTGQLNRFLEVQTDFSRRGLWARTAVLHRPQKSAKPREGL
jgi:biopolymer transport protein ExbD